MGVWLKGAAFAFIAFSKHVVENEKPHAVKVLALASFSNALEDAEGGPVSRRVDYSKEKLSTDQSMLEQFGREVAAVAVAVEESYKVPMDMEGIVLEGPSGREIHLVQARPIVEG